jgi:hypothetical protein
MKLECGIRKLNGATLYFEKGSRNIYCNFPGREEYVNECEPPYKIVFQPEKIGRVPDLEHQEWVKCLENSLKEGCLNEAEFNRRVARGRPVTKWRYNPNEKKKSISKTPRRSIDINAIIASVVELSKETAPYASLKLQNEKQAASVRNEEDDESRMQRDDAAYTQSVNNTVSRSVSV